MGTLDLIRVLGACGDPAFVDVSDQFAELPHREENANHFLHTLRGPQTADVRSFISEPEFQCQSAYSSGIREFRKSITTIRNIICVAFSPASGIGPRRIGVQLEFWNEFSQETPCIGWKVYTDAPKIAVKELNSYRWDLGVRGAIFPSRASLLSGDCKVPGKKAEIFEEIKGSHSQLLLPVESIQDIFCSCKAQVMTIESFTSEVVQNLPGPNVTAATAPGEDKGGTPAGNLEATYFSNETAKKAKPLSNERDLVSGDIEGPSSFPSPDSDGPETPHGAFHTDGADFVGMRFQNPTPSLGTIPVHSLGQGLESIGALIVQLDAISLSSTENCQSNTLVDEISDTSQSILPVQSSFSQEPEVADAMVFDPHPERIGIFLRDDLNHEQRELLERFAILPSASFTQVPQPNPFPHQYRPQGQGYRYHRPQYDLQPSLRPLTERQAREQQFLAEQAQVRQAKSQYYRARQADLQQFRPPQGDAQYASRHQDLAQRANAQHGYIPHAHVHQTPEQRAHEQYAYVQQAAGYQMPAQQANAQHVYRPQPYVPHAYGHQSNLEPNPYRRPTQTHLTVQQHGNEIAPHQFPAGSYPAGQQHASFEQGPSFDQRQQLGHYPQQEQRTFSAQHAPSMPPPRIASVLFGPSVPFVPLPPSGHAISYSTPVMYSQPLPIPSAPLQYGSVPPPARPAPFGIPVSDRPRSAYTRNFVQRAPVQGNGQNVLGREVRQKATRKQKGRGISAREADALLWPPIQAKGQKALETEVPDAGNEMRKLEKSRADYLDQQGRLAQGHVYHPRQPQSSISQQTSATSRQHLRHFSTSQIPKPGLITKVESKPVSRNSLTPTNNYIMNSAPQPTTIYLVQAAQPTLPLEKPQPLLIISDLNGTLICREKSGKGSVKAEKIHSRPGMSTLLKNLFGNMDLLSDATPRPQHKFMIWTSAMRHTLERILPRLLSKEEQGQLVATWSREKFGLSQQDFHGKVQVYKMLSLVWADDTIQKTHPLYEEGKRWNQTNTVLIDDSKLKAATEPYNLLEIPELTLETLAKEESGPPAVLEHVQAYLEEASRSTNVSAWMKRNPFTMGNRWAPRHDRGATIEPEISVDE